MNNAPTILRGVLRCGLAGPAILLAAVISLAGPAAGGEVELKVAAEPGEAAPLRIEPPVGAVKPFALVIIRGLTGNERLEPGIRSGDAWYVSAKDLPALKIIASARAGQVLELTASFVQPDNSASAVRSFALRLEPRAVTPGTGTEAAGTEGAGKQAGAPPPPEEERRSLDEAAALMKNGDVAGARLLFEDLAVQGSALGAFAMGQTFDPNVLARLPVQGLAPDPVKARQWYEKAGQLGSREAAGALKVLAGAGR